MAQKTKKSTNKPLDTTRNIVIGASIALYVAIIFLGLLQGIRYDSILRIWQGNWRVIFAVLILYTIYVDVVLFSFALNQLQSRRKKGDKLNTRNPSILETARNFLMLALVGVGALVINLIWLPAMTSTLLKGPNTYSGNCRIAYHTPAYWGKADSGEHRILLYSVDESPGVSVGLSEEQFESLETQPYSDASVGVGGFFESEGIYECSSDVTVQYIPVRDVAVEVTQ